MPTLELVLGDITKENVDAIVNAGNETLLGGGGVDGAIHSAAGPQLREACKVLGGCKTGDAKITHGFALPAKFVIHTVGPRWTGGGAHEEELLASCYRRSLELAVANDVRSISFPAISAGIFGFPKDKAARISVSTIKKCLEETDALASVRILVIDEDVWRAYRKALGMPCSKTAFWKEKYCRTPKAK